MAETILIERRYRGPDQSGNGGYTSGLVAGLVSADTVEVTLRVPPPLDTPLQVQRTDLVVRVLDGDRLVAEARPAELELDLPEPVAYDEAERLSAARAPDPNHPFPNCFTCGPARAEGDGLRLRPAPLGDGRVAAPWRPFASEPELVWAALDCPGAFAVDPGFARGVSVLGRLTARIVEVPQAGDECVVVAWPLGQAGSTGGQAAGTRPKSGAATGGGEGRRHNAGTVVFRDGVPLAFARAVWFLLEDEVPSAG